MKRSLLGELKRRNVLKAAVLYIGIVWALSQGAAQLLPVFDAPNWAVRWLVVASIVGFPFWIALAWFFELTPYGLKLESDIAPSESVAIETGRKLDFWIIGVLAVVVVLLLTDRFVLHRDAGAVTEKSIAVLPFANLSSDKEQEYLSDGIAEDVLDLLTRIPQLQVRARTSSFSFKGKDVGIPEIARHLQVAHILEGTVQKVGDKVRITAQLVDAATGTQRWSKTWDRELVDIFAIQDEIAADVVKQLKVTLLGAAPKARVTDPRTYALYLQAVELYRKGTAEALGRSGALLDQALAIDPRYVPALVERAELALAEEGFGVLASTESQPRANAALTMALEIDPDYPQAHVLLGWFARKQLDLATAARHYARALSLDPNDSNVLTGAAALLATLGRLDEAVAVDQAAVRRDPVNVSALYGLAYYQYLDGRLGEATESLHSIFGLSPGFEPAHGVLSRILLDRGKPADALAEVERWQPGVRRTIALVMTYHALGRKAESDGELEALMTRYGKGWSYYIASVCAFRGDADDAFKWLDKAVEDHDRGLQQIPIENLFSKIHSDQRWTPFLRRIGIAPEQLAKIEFKVTLPAAESGMASSGANH